MMKKLNCGKLKTEIGPGNRKAETPAPQRKVKSHER